ncbi:hypothetical protein TNIN_85831 [Trichonephila inaurata madagascariensis]|uniref:Uncharacterized protein n=1 Tax=Trichonephila inaurata madagascariensis TaxID=2747483 RepID=A0A8X6Y9V7_9ARAC|nr:hypothetical protein TNIN_85831 [Trichonephila inaurata madagascariensis]
MLQLKAVYMLIINFTLKKNGLSGAVEAGENVKPSEGIAERIPISPAAETERPDTPLEMVDPSLIDNEVEVTPYIPTPPLITRCEKSTKTIPPILHVKRLELGKRLMEEQPTDPLSVECTNQKSLPHSFYYKSRAQKPVASFYARDIEDELAFVLNLALNQEADLGDYITFMMNFRTVLNNLKHSEVIELQTVYGMNIIDLMMQILPDNEPHNAPWLECFSYSEPADLHSDHVEQEAFKGKGEFIQFLCTVYAKPKLYGLAYKSWRQHRAQTLVTWTQLAQEVMDGCFNRNDPIVYLQCQTRAPLTQQWQTCAPLPQHDALARKDTLWPCVSHTLPPTTPGCKKHLPPLQGTQPIESTQPLEVNTMLRP